MTFRPCLLWMGLSVITLAGCANEPSYNPFSAAPSDYGNTQTETQEVFYGYVTSVQPVELERHNTLGVGAVLGAVIGGVVGNQFGHGVGNDLTTAGGVVAGGVIGNSIQNHVDQRQGLEIGVQLNDGHQVAIIQAAGDDHFSPGERVRVVGYGANARVVHY
jgi:outer membrane lipoprotein SlyB